MGIHTIRENTLAAFMEAVSRITEAAVERGQSYTVSAMRRTDGEWNALITVEGDGNE